MMFKKADDAVDTMSDRKECGSAVRENGQRSYVLITPAKNEAGLIRGALESVISQTEPPSQWVIVDDGSTDDSSRIVKEYMQRYSYIHLVSLAGERKREFSSKAVAFNAGLEAVAYRDYVFVGNLDADVTLEPDYYETVLDTFEQDSRLGIAGGSVYTTIDGEPVCNDNTMDSVGGAVQLFRRTCFEEIGGYRRLPFGGIDAAAEIMARWRGWRVSKIDKRVSEHRRTGSAQTSAWKGRYRDGYKFHSLGYGGLFFTCKCLFRVKDNPKVIGSVFSMLGFAVARLRGYPVCLPQEAVVYLRSEQKVKLRLWFHRLCGKLNGRNANDDKSSNSISSPAPADETSN
jgi:glycosyltransferase involved in cell wall biosynthesis